MGDYSVLVTSYPSAFATIEDAVSHVQEQLTARRIFHDYREIHFVAHSMGGLIVKRLLADLNRGPTSEMLSRVRSVILLGTPSQGTDIAALGAWLAMYPQLGGMTPSKLNDYLVVIEKQWRNLLNDRREGVGTALRAHCVVETRPTYGVVVVSRAQATTGCDSFLPVDADHVAIAKPASRADNLYESVKSRLLEDSSETGSAVGTRSRPRAFAGRPRVVAYFDDGFVQVGRFPGIVDEAVTAIVHVVNVSDETAIDVGFDFLFHDGWRKVSFLEDWYRPQQLPPPYIPRLGRGERASWRFAPRVGANAVEAYRTGRLRFRAKLQLMWRDLDGRAYRFVQLARLVYSPPHEGFAGAFRFSNEGRYSSLDNSSKVDRLWGPMQ